LTEYKTVFAELSIFDQWAADSVHDFAHSAQTIVAFQVDLLLFLCFSTPGALNASRDGFYLFDSDAFFSLFKSVT